MWPCYFHIIYSSIFELKPFFSFRVFYLLSQFLCLLTCLSLAFSFVFLLVLKGIFWFLFALFLMLWMLVTLNKAKFSLQKRLKTFRKIPALIWILVTVCKIEFTSWKTSILFKCSFSCPLISTIIIFSKAHAIACFHTLISKLE